MCQLRSRNPVLGAGARVMWVSGDGEGCGVALKRRVFRVGEAGREPGPLGQDRAPPHASVTLSIKWEQQQMRSRLAWSKDAEERNCEFPKCSLLSFFREGVKTPLSGDMKTVVRNQM